MRAVAAHTSFTQGENLIAAKFWHVTLAVENMELMRDFYTRVIGMEETVHVFFEDPETSSPTPGAIQYPGLNEGVSWDVKIEDQKYKDEDHDFFLTLMKFHNKPSEKPKSVTSPLFWGWGGHVGYLVDDLPSVLQRMGEEQLGKIIKTSGPDGAPNHAYIYDPEGNGVELKAKEPNE